jgi:hypothetical protein
MLGPRTLPDPIVGRVWPVSIVIIVVFPDPFGPRSPNNDPLSTEKETFSTAVKPQNFLSGYLLQVQLPCPPVFSLKENAFSSI